MVAAAVHAQCHGLLVCTQYVMCSSGHNVLGVSGQVTLSVWPSTTKYHGLSVSEVYFLQFWRLGVQDQDAVLWAADSRLLTVPSHGQRKGKQLWLLPIRGI